MTSLSYSDLIAGAVACPGCDAQKPGEGSLPCSTANTNTYKLIPNSNTGYNWYHVSNNLLDLFYQHYDCMNISFKFLEFLIFLTHQY